MTVSVHMAKGETYNYLDTMMICYAVVVVINDIDRSWPDPSNSSRSVARVLTILP